MMSKLFFNIITQQSWRCPFFECHLSLSESITQCWSTCSCQQQSVLFFFCFCSIKSVQDFLSQFCCIVDWESELACTLGLVWSLITTGWSYFNISVQWLSICHSLSLLKVFFYSLFCLDSHVKTIRPHLSRDCFVTRANKCLIRSIILECTISICCVSWVLLNNLL